MRRRPPRSTRTDTLFPYTTLFRSRAKIRRSDAAGSAWPRSGKQAGDLVRCAPDGELQGCVRMLGMSMDRLERSHAVRRDAAAAEQRLDVRRVPLSSMSSDEALRSRILPARAAVRRSEERRVGKECVSTFRSRCSPYNEKQNKQS